MAPPVLKTKLYIPPPRPELVPRPRLIERLNAGLHRKLTCISAPAGFGKTTLVSEWAAALRSGGQRSARVAWLSLDESDNDLTRFLTYLIAALETIEPGVGKGALSALEASGLQSPQPPPMEGILTALINALSSAASNATAPMVLVLDDYHLIDDDAGPRGRGEAGATVHDALTFLLRHLPPSDPVAGGLHLVITTRVDPPLPLARLRARGQLNEVRAADLRFLSAEAAEFLNQAMGLKLPAEYIAALERRTEGWIAGLQLAALALQGTSMQGSIDVQGFIQSFAGSHRYVLDYLIEEVLEQQSESLQTFMLRTALLDRLTGSLCDAVTDQSSGQATLEALDRANLFIVPLDAERGWFRYHRLFSDLIRKRLRQTQPQLASTLHIRASEWYEQNGYTDEAIEHALRAKAYERMARLIEEHIDALWGRGEHATLHGWLDRLPAELVSARPHLCILKAWYLFASGQLDAAEQLLRAAADTERSPTERDPASDLDRDKIRGRIATIRAFLAFYRGDVERIAEYARRALEHLPEQDLVWRSTATVVLGDAYGLAGELEAAHPVRLQALAASKAVGNTYMILIAAVKLAVTLRQQGWFEQSIEVCRRHVEYAQEIGMSHASEAGCLLAIWGEALAELGDLDEALERAQRGVELAERGKDLMIVGWSHLCLVRVLISRGELSAAQEICTRSENLDREYGIPPWIGNLMAAWQARIWLAQDKLEAASQWVRERALDADRVPPYPRELEYIVLARILIAQGRLTEAAPLLQRLLEATEAGGRISRAIEVLLLQALALQAGGDTDQALAALERALTLAAPRGLIQVFVNEGPPMAALLYQAATRGIMPDYTGQLLAAFPAVDASPVAPPKVSTSQIRVQPAVGTVVLEPLSEREIEVLELVAEGLTNQEIASRLFLSLHTIKAHTRNIYGKLDVHNRTEAVARGRALGVLSST